MAIDRATGEDVVTLETDLGTVPLQVGAVLVLDGGLDHSQLLEVLDRRIRAIPRLRQRLERTPLGAGRPIWVDDAGFELRHHVTTRRCPDPGDEPALLEVATEVVVTRLPRDRPLWRAVHVTGMPAGDALVVAFHHVLADGIGGLAVLANLVDETATGAGTAEDFPRPRPADRDVALDAWRERFGALRRLPAGLRTLADAVRQLRRAPRVRAGPSSLNRPTGAQRRLRVVRVDLDPVVDAAHRSGVKVNDVVLSAVSGALRELLAARGEAVDRFAISVPVAARPGTGAGELGNRVGVMPVEVPATDDAHERLLAVARATRAAKEAAGAASLPWLGPVFRVLARLGAFSWFVDHQRLVHTFVTNLRGPEARLHLLGEPVASIWPVAMVTGNVTVSFAVLSYAGALCVTLIADPDAVPDLDRLAGALHAHLTELGRPELEEAPVPSS